jgi:pimeloyl-ACP methyl ester carboxylesterase
VLPTLAAGWQVIATELQGHGHTADIDRDTTLDNLADDVVALLDELASERVDLFGYSLGGRTALRVAMLHRDRVGRLVAAATHYRSDGYHPGIRPPQPAVADGEAAYGSTPGPATMRRSNNATAWTTLDRYRSAAPGRYLRRPPPLLPARRGPSATDPGDGGQVCPMPTQPDIDEVVARYGRDELGAGAAVAALREALPSVLVDTATSRLLTPDQHRRLLDAAQAGAEAQEVEPGAGAYRHHATPRPAGAYLNPGAPVIPGAYRDPDAGRPGPAG